VSASPENTTDGMVNGASVLISLIKPVCVVGRYPLYITARSNVFELLARYTGMNAAPCENPMMAKNSPPCDAIKLSRYVIESSAQVGSVVGLSFPPGGSCIHKLLVGASAYINSNVLLNCDCNATIPESAANALPVWPPPCNINTFFLVCVAVGVGVGVAVAVAVGVGVGVPVAVGVGVTVGVGVGVPVAVGVGVTVGVGVGVPVAVGVGVILSSVAVGVGVDEPVTVGVGVGVPVVVGVGVGVLVVVGVGTGVGICSAGSVLMFAPDG